MTAKVYLAGPITGLSYGGATDWREFAKSKLAEISGGQILGLSPMRHKDYLLAETTIGDSYDQHIMSSQRGITARDRFDTFRADVILVNVLGAAKPSLGTVMEIAWADAMRVPVVLVMEPEGNPHEHAMIREVCPFRVATLEEALSVIYRILMP